MQLKCAAKITIISVVNGNCITEPTGMKNRKNNTDVFTDWNSKFSFIYSSTAKDNKILILTLRLAVDKAGLQ